MAVSEAYLGLARKYRPQTFEDLIGQEAVADSLTNALRQNRVVQGHLMSGPRGTGKTTTARILARALNCVEGPTPKPCGVCRHCIDIAAGNDMDVIEVDGASNNSVDNIRELRENVNLSPFAARYKIYIIDEVHMLSTGAFNALLKTLEEPPAGVVFVFATTEIEKVPETIRSRCAMHQFRRITADDIVRRLMQVAEAEKIDLAPDAAREIFGHIARAVDGGMRDAMMIFDQLLALTDGRPDAETAIKLLGVSDPGALARTIDWLTQGNAGELLKLVEDLAQRGRSLERFVKELVAYLRDLMLLQAGADAALIDLTGEALDLARRQARELEPAPLYNMVNQILELEERIKNSTQTRFLLEFAFLRLARIKPVVPLDEIMNRIQAMPEASLGGGREVASANIAGSGPALQVAEAPSQVRAKTEARSAPARPPASSRFAPAMAVMQDSAPAAAEGNSPLMARQAAAPAIPVLSGLGRADLLDLLDRQLPETSQFLLRYLKQAADLSMDGATLRALWRPEDSLGRRMVEKLENTQRIEAALSQIAGQAVKLTNLESNAASPLAAASNPALSTPTVDSAISPRAPRMADSGFMPDDDAPHDEDAREAPDRSPSITRASASPAPSRQMASPAGTAPKITVAADSRTALERAQAFLAGNEEAPRRFKLLRDMFKGQPIDENGQPLTI